MSIRTNKEVLQEIIGLQGKIALCGEAANSLEVAIKNKEEELAGLLPPESSLKELQEKREDMLADIAIGKASQEEINLLDRSIEEEKTRIELLTRNNPAVELIPQTIAGLKRKLAAVEADLAELETARYHAIQWYLVNEAEHVGQEYLVVAKQLAARHRQLLALNVILGKHHQGATFEMSNQTSLVIPLFNLDVHKEAGFPGYPVELREAVSTYRDSGCLLSAAQIELQKIRSLGIPL